MVDTIISRSAADTERLGGALAATLPRGAIIALTGDLGAGKTCFARGVCRALGWHGDVTSPTFTLVHEYGAENGLVCHVDLYRLDTVEDAYALGLDELFASAVCSLVEWADKFPELLPARTVWVNIGAFSSPTESQDVNARRVTVRIAAG